jgi:hypothetical protein
LVRISNVQNQRCIADFGTTVHAICQLLLKSKLVSAFAFCEECVFFTMFHNLSYLEKVFFSVSVEKKRHQSAGRLGKCMIDCIEWKF